MYKQMLGIQLPWFYILLPYAESVSFVLIHFVIGELLLEANGRVSHGLVLAWFKSCVLCLVFLESSLQSPGQEIQFGILLLHLLNVVYELHLYRHTVNREIFVLQCDNWC